VLSERARRLGSTALILGGVAWAVVWFAAPLVEDEGPWRAALNPALVLVAAGVWVFYVRLVAAALVVVGTVAMLLANLLARDLFAVAALVTLFAVAALVTIAAHLLLGVAIVRTGVLPRETGLAFAGGLAAVVAGAMLPPLLGVGWLLWGYVLLAAPPVEVPAEYR